MQNSSDFKKFLSSKGGKALIIFVLYAILLAIFVTVVQFLGTTAGSIVALICAIFGWKALNKIQPNIFLIMPVIGWLIFFLVKGILSIALGCFVMPFEVAKWIAGKIQIEE